MLVKSRDRAHDRVDELEQRVAQLQHRLWMVERDLHHERIACDSYASSAVAAREAQEVVASGLNDMYTRQIGLDGPASSASAAPRAETAEKRAGRNFYGCPPSPHKVWQWAANSSKSLRILLWAPRFDAI